MMGRAAAGAKSWHGKASRWAGKFGSDAKLPGSVTDGVADTARQQALDARGSFRVNAGLGIGAATMVTRNTRSSSGRDGLNPHSMGGTTL